MQASAYAQEFERNLPIYRYFKVIGHKVIVPPRLNTDNSQLPSARISLDWADGTGENVIQDDGSKEIPAYSTRNHVFRFKAPDVLIKAPTGNYYFNYANWLPSNQTSGFVPPGYIKISSAFTFNYTVETLIAFKGSQTQTASTVKIIKMKRLEEIKEDEKEQEKDEEKEEDKEENDNEKKDLENQLNNLFDKINKLGIK